LTNVIKPAGLQEGDKVVLISPSGASSKEKIDAVALALKELGLVVEIYEQNYENIGYLAGTDESKLEALHKAFVNRDVKGIFCVRGGYGCARLLDSLDYDLIRSNPKVLVGMSDITALQSAILQKAGLITYHGPMALHFMNEERKFALDNLRKILFNGERKIDLGGEVLRLGEAEGQLIGGNLAMLQSMLATEYEYNYNNAILFFEEVGEYRYSIDRMLQHLRMAGRLKNLKAIIVGQNAYCENDIFGYSFEEILKNVTKDLDIPIVIGSKFGHKDHHLTLPVGESIKLTLTEAEQSIIF